MRLIDAERLKADVFKASMDEHFMPMKLLDCDTVTEMIDDAPTIEERNTGKWNLVEIHNCYAVYHCSECKRQLTVFHRFCERPSRAKVAEDYPYCHCGLKMEVDECGE